MHNEQILDMLKKSKRMLILLPEYLPKFSGLFYFLLTPRAAREPSLTGVVGQGPALRRTILRYYALFRIERRVSHTYVEFSTIGPMCPKQTNLYTYSQRKKFEKI